MLRQISQIAMLVFMGTYCFSQVQNTIQSEKTLYRGYTNTVLLSDLPFNQKGITLVGIENITLTKQDANTYNAIPGHQKSSKIQVLTEAGQVLGQLEFQVRNMPKPDLYVCDVLNGGSIHGNCAELKYTLPSDCQIDAVFKIVSWECSYANAKSVQGTSENYTALKSMIANAPSGTSLQISVKVEGPDGLIRLANGIWTKA